MKLLMREDKSGQVTLYDKIDPQRLEEASHAAARIHALLEDLAFGDSVRDALDELKEACQLTRINQDLLHRRIERKTKAYLSDFYILINHWQTKSSHLGFDKQFTTLTHQAYNKSREYGLSYYLRNHAIHHDHIVACIHGEIGYSRIVPMANRDVLLSTNNWKPDEKNFLLTLPEYFDLIPVFEKSCEAVLAFHHSMMDLLLSEQTVSDCQVLMALMDSIKQLDAAPGYWDIIEFFDDKEQPLDPKDLPIISRASCSRCYANWNVYPILRNRAVAVLKSQTQQSKA